MGDGSNGFGFGPSDVFFHVRGLGRYEGAKWQTIRKFPDREAAIDFALKVNMQYFDDVKVEPRREAPKVPDEPPALPFAVTWVRGFAYIVDARGRKIASLLGPQLRREQFAAMLEKAFPCQSSINESGSTAS